MKLLTLDQAVSKLNEVHQNNPAVTGRNVFSKRTLYNYIYQRKLKRHGPRHMAQVEETELLSLLG